MKTNAHNLLIWRSCIIFTKLIWIQYLLTWKVIRYCVLALHGRMRHGRLTGWCRWHGAPSMQADGRSDGFSVGCESPSGLCRECVNISHDPPTPDSTTRSKLARKNSAEMQRQIPETAHLKSEQFMLFDQMSSDWTTNLNLYLYDNPLYQCCPM